MKNNNFERVILVLGSLVIIAAFIIPAIAIGLLIANSDWHIVAKLLGILYEAILFIRTYQLGMLLNEAKSYKS